MKKNDFDQGMMCAHCQMHVQKALAAIDGVCAVDVNLEEKKATVTLAKVVPDQAMMDAVTQAGYTRSAARRSKKQAKLPPVEKPLRGNKAVLFPERLFVSV